MTAISDEQYAEFHIRELMNAVWNAEQAKAQLDYELTEALKEHGKPVEWELPGIRHRGTIVLGHAYGDPDMPAATCVLHHGFNVDDGSYYEFVKPGRLMPDYHIKLGETVKDEDAGREATSTD